MNLLASNHKLQKEVVGWELLGLSLAPADIALPGHSVCPWSTCDCRRLCINTSGLAQVSGEVYQEESAEQRHANFMRYQIHRARIIKTLLFLKSRPTFMLQLDAEIKSKKALVRKRGNQLAVRLNVFSDLSWESFPVDTYKNIMEAHTDVQFYDYTKSVRRILNFSARNLPVNYDLILSRSEDMTDESIRVLLGAGGVNIAVVFHELPAMWLGYKVINGDVNDHRFLDPKGVIVGLKAKARAIKDRSGFVV